MGKWPLEDDDDEESALLRGARGSMPGATGAPAPFRAPLIAEPAKAPPARSPMPLADIGVGADSSHSLTDLSRASVRAPAAADSFEGETPSAPAMATNRQGFLTGPDRDAEFSRTFQARNKLLTGALTQFDHPIEAPAKARDVAFKQAADELSARSQATMVQAAMAGRKQDETERKNLVGEGLAGKALEQQKTLKQQEIENQKAMLTVAKQRADQEGNNVLSEVLDRELKQLALVEDVESRRIGAEAQLTQAESKSGLNQARADQIRSMQELLVEEKDEAVRGAIQKRILDLQGAVKRGEVSMGPETAAQQLPQVFQRTGMVAPGPQLTQARAAGQQLTAPADAPPRPVVTQPAARAPREMNPALRARAGQPAPRVQRNAPPMAPIGQMPPAAAPPVLPEQAAPPAPASRADIGGVNEALLMKANLPPDAISRLVKLMNSQDPAKKAKAQAAYAQIVAGVSGAAR